MTSVRCPECQLTNWATAIACKRCGHLFQAAEAVSGSFEPEQNNFGGHEFDGENQTAPQPSAPANYQPQTDWAPNSSANQNYQSQNYQNYGQPNYGYSPPANLKSGLAIASMVLGILGFITSIFLVGILLAPIGLILGIIALVKANKNPETYGGKGFAIAGVVTSGMIVLFIPIVAAIAVPNLLAARRAANEGSAIGSIRTLSSAEAVFMATAGAGKCGDLKTLGSQTLIDSALAQGEKSGYRFMVVNLPTLNGGCEILAAPLTASTGTRSFYFSTEDGIIRAADKKGKFADKNDLPLGSDVPSYSKTPPRISTR